MFSALHLTFFQVSLQSTKNGHGLWLGPPPAKHEKNLCAERSSQAHPQRDCPLPIAFPQGQTHLKTQIQRAAGKRNPQDVQRQSSTEERRTEVLRRGIWAPSYLLLAFPAFSREFLNATVEETASLVCCNGTKAGLIY